MPAETSAVRKTITRTLAIAALLGVYCTGMVATTGAFMAATTTAADAQGRGRGWRGRGRGWRGRGRGRGRGWRGRGWRGWRGRGVVVCRHQYWSSRRVCWVR